MKKIVKKIIFTLTAVIIVLFITYVLILLFRPCNAPERVEGIPVSAVWHGGCDGGFWFELVERKGDIFRFRIYNEGTGLLLVDADFIAEDICSEKIDTIRNIHDVINYYNEEIFLTVIEREKYCRLIMIKPVYYKLR